MTQTAPLFDTLRSQSRGLQIAVVTLALGATGFFVDLMEDLLEYERELAEGPVTALLSFFWLGAMTVAILLAARVLVQEILRRQREVRAFDRQVTLMRGEFQSVLEHQFDEWSLTRAERDIALLILKGLKSCDIAKARNTAEGTIRAQTSAVFRKVGVSTRTEMMSLFLDTFLVAEVGQPRGDLASPFAG